MMYNSPFFNYPYYRKFSKKDKDNYLTKQYPNNPYSSNTIYTPNYNLANYYNSFLTQNVPKNNSIKSINSSKCNFQKPLENKNNKDEETFQQELFELFGLKLYFDDILLICLVFFLYNEGVKDYYLFISLILLLLS